MSDKTLTVYAIRDGFYESYRRPGDAFTITDPDVSFSKRWMVPADTEAGRAFIKRHSTQQKAAVDAITGERLQSGGSAEELVMLRQQMAELKAEIAAQSGKSLGAKAKAAKEPAITPAEPLMQEPAPAPTSKPEEAAKPAKARRRRAAP